MLLIITSTNDVLFDGINIDDLEGLMTLNPKMRVFGDFLRFLAAKE